MFTFRIFLILSLLGSPLLAHVPTRVSHVEGTAAVAHQGEVDWLEVTINLPVREGDRFFLQENSRVELEFDEGSFVRLGPRSDSVFQKVSARDVQIQLTLGDLILRSNSNASFTVTTPLAAISMRDRGLYRLSVDSKGETRVVVRKGAAEVATQARSKRLYAGGMLTVSGPEDSLADVSLEYQKDDFDVWSERHDAAYVSNRSTRYLNGRKYAGSYDLDRYGQWGYVSSYGHVWWPHASVDWDPYCSGRWVHYPDWGWTWVSYEPWGWLTYHYGRWIHVPYYSRWCWVPGYSSWTWSPAAGIQNPGPHNSGKFFSRFDERGRLLQQRDLGQRAPQRGFQPPGRPNITTIGPNGTSGPNVITVGPNDASESIPSAPRTVPSAPGTMRSGPGGLWSNRPSVTAPFFRPMPRIPRTAPSERIHPSPPPAPRERSFPGTGRPSPQMERSFPRMERSFPRIDRDRR